MSSEPPSQRPAQQSSPQGAVKNSVSGWSGDFVESLYRQWQADPESVEPQWRQFFLGFELGSDRGAVPAPGPAAPVSDHQRKVDRLIEAYRAKGHFAARIDPLGTERPFPAELALDAFGLGDAQLDERFDPGTLPLAAPATLREIVGCLEDTYCGTIGVEFVHIGDEDRRRWLTKRMEAVRNRPAFPDATRIRLLEQLIDAHALESFLEKRYIGKKRFGLEGGESLIPLLDQIVELAPQNGVGEITMGMAHRGRINVLANILNKKWDKIFTEFEEAWVDDFLAGGGDVKYHHGYSSDHETSGGQVVRLTLAPNPSHLEFVNSVVLGRCRAKQQLAGDLDRRRVMPVLIHGDAAFPGQGIVAECFNLMHLDGYSVGGTIHVVVNNQVGFTTDPEDGWSGHYCTDLAKAWECPILHVNGDDPEACAWAARLAVEWRQTFGSDVVIDMVCYRKNGHNETDEPSFTQPLLYKRIRRHQPVIERYRDRLVEAGLLTRSRYDELHAALVQRLDEAQTRTKSQPVAPRIDPFQRLWKDIEPNYSHETVDTGVAADRLRRVAEAFGRIPEEIAPHKTVAKLYAARAEVGNDEAAPIDWATAELLAYGSLLLEGHPVRLTGQDVERGTFSHRHAIVRCQETGAKYSPLGSLAAEGAASFLIHNSPLSEASCVGYEYGYSLCDPRTLVVWEAQFGDFANGAQVLIDQFLASAEVKWRRSSGLVLLLPHGYEGQGPEHSSARLERFLQLCADDNLQVAYPTTSAQIFHLLRKQIRQRFRKPLVVMTPKSMLRLPAAMSPFGEFVKGHFRPVLSDPAFVGGHDGGNDPEKVNRILLVSGKLAHELFAWREKSGQFTTAVVRLEQLYPFPDAMLSKVLAQYPKAERFVWVQEEPRNMGAYRFCQAQLKELLGIDVSYIGRPDSATPASGSSKLHVAQQEKILLEAMGPQLPSDTSAATEPEAAGAKNSKRA